MPASDARGAGGRRPRPSVALLTGGGDRPYALGLARSLIEQGVVFDFIGSDDLRAPVVCDQPQVRFLNMRGNQDPDASIIWKVRRVAFYYVRLIRYAATSDAPIFHILWNNKVELFDRTLLQLFYRLRGKQVVMTLHNVNREARDGRDSALNRLTLRVQYALSEHLFVHTERMRTELIAAYGVHPDRVSVIPFGINSTVPDTAMTGAQARARLGFRPEHQVVLFFGNIAPYKGVEYLVQAFARLARTRPECRLVIAGRPKRESYWASIEEAIVAGGLGDRVIRRIEYVPDADTEIYFKAADVLALPYLHVFQSGVLFLAYNFGLPAVVTDVASLADDIVEGVTGFACAPGNAGSFADALERYFASALYRDRDALRQVIRDLGQERHSWSIVGRITNSVYARLLAARQEVESHGS